MRQSVLRFLAAAFVAVLSASLLIGTVGAKGPVPDQPPAIDRTPSGNEESIVTGIPVTMVVSDLGISTVVVSTPAEAAAYGATMNSEVEVVCKKAHHTFRHSKFKLEAELRFCWNINYPPSEITSHDRYGAVSTATDPGRPIGAPSHKKSGGGAGFTYVETRAKGKFCVPSVQDDNTTVCEGYTRLYIDAEHKVGGASKGVGSVTWESAS
ncbi:MAG: hypothetical protein OXI70_04530 [Chloroflexota bacterium]|nr:hypothetical protein [Chloroflexota bacterium]